MWSISLASKIIRKLFSSKCQYNLLLFAISFTKHLFCLISYARMGISFSSFNDVIFGTETKIIATNSFLKFDINFTCGTLFPCLQIKGVPHFAPKTDEMNIRFRAVWKCVRFGCRVHVRWTATFLLSGIQCHAIFRTEKNPFSISQATESYFLVLRNDLCLQKPRPGQVGVLTSIWIAIYTVPYPWKRPGDKFLRVIPLRPSSW